MQGRPHTDEKQMPPPYTYSEDNFTDDTGSTVVTKPRSAIRRLLAFAVGASPKTIARFSSAKRRWSFVTRFMPSGPDTFYLSATPETREATIEHFRSINEELPLRFGMMSVCDADHHTTDLQGSPSSEPQIAMIMPGSALSEPHPSSIPVATDQDCTQIAYPGGCSLVNHQLYPPVDSFATHNGALLDQSYGSVDLDTEMDGVENAMTVDYIPLPANDFLLPSTVLPVIPYTGPPELQFSSRLYFGAEGNHDGQIANDIGHGFDPFHSTFCQHSVTPGYGGTDDSPADTKEDDDVFVPPDNVLHRPPLEAPSAIVEENEADGLCTPQKAASPPAVLETCRTPLIPRQYQPEVREREPDAGTDVDTEDEAEPRKSFERETTEPLEEGEDKPPAAFFRFDQGVSTGSLEDSNCTSALPSRQIPPSSERENHGLKSSFPETPVPEEGREKLLAAVSAEAERLLDSLERQLCSPPRVPQQIMPSTTGDDESTGPFERESTEPLEDGEDQTPTAFLNFEQRTDTQSSRQCQSTINDDRPEPFKRKATEPLEEGEDQTPTAFLSYDQRVTPKCLGDNNVDALSPIFNPVDNENESDRSFVREPTEPLEDGEDEPPAAFIPPYTIPEHQATTQSTILSTFPSQMVHFAPIQSQPEPRTSYSVPHTNRRLVLNKHGLPMRPLTRAKFKRALGGAPCDFSSLVNTTSWQPSGAGAGDDGDEREDRTDPSKRARCDSYKVPADHAGNKQVRFGGSRRAHFHNAVARFSARSQGPVTPRRSILRSTGNETQLSTSPLSNLSIVTPPSGAVGTITRLRSPLPPTSLSCTNSRSNKNLRKTQVTETVTESDSDVEPPRKPARLFVDELDHKRRRAPHHLPTDANGGAVRHTRRRHREDWIHERRKRGCQTDDSPSWFLGEPRKQKRKGPLSGISVRFRLPDIQPVGA